MQTKSKTRKSPSALKKQQKPALTTTSGKTIPVPGNRQKTGTGFGAVIPPEVGKATQWRPGVSGNPTGRPKSHGLLQVLRAAVDVVDADGRTIEEKLIGVLVEEALEGRNRLPALALIFDRLEGRAPQQLDINNISKATGTPAERIDALLKLAAQSAEEAKK